MEILQFVGKTTFPGQITPTQSKQFWNEMHFYSDIVPAIEQFEQSKNIPETDRVNAFAQYFGSRLSSDDGESLNSKGIITSGIS